MNRIDSKLQYEAPAAEEFKAQLCSHEHLSSSLWLTQISKTSKKEKPFKGPLSLEG